MSDPFDNASDPFDNAFELLLEAIARLAQAERAACDGYWSTNDPWQPMVSAHYLLMIYGSNHYAYIHEGQRKS